MCALLVQFVYSPNIIGFFSYFTIMSNAFATGIFLYIGLQHNDRLSKKLESFFGATVVYMFITGLGYWVLLSNTVYPEMIPWVNIIIHAVMPIAVFIGWIIYEHSHTLETDLAFSWISFPFIFLVYTLLRGVMVNWYPYPFLDPRTSMGYFRVFEYAVAFTIGFYIVGQVIIRIGNNIKKA